MIIRTATLNSSSSPYQNNEMNLEDLNELKLQIPTEAAGSVS